MARNDVYLNINALSPADAVVTGQQDMTAATVPELVLGDTPTFNFYFTDNTNVWPSWAGNASYSLTWALSDAVAGDFAPAATTGNATPITGGWSVVLPLNSYDLVGLLNTKRVGQPYPVTNLWQQLRVTDPSGNEITRAMFWTPVRYRAISDTQNTESASPTGGRFVTVNNVNTLTTPTAAQFYAANPVPTSALGTAANGELLIGNGSGFTKSTLTAGTGITVTNGSGSITIDASGAQETLTATVKNAESVAITKGQVVYLFGATGGFASVKLAYNTSDATSAKTFGVVSSTSIAANGTGTVTCVGVVDGLNLGAYNDGDTLYLGATPGSVTATKPYAPNHLVYVGIVERANNGNGELYVRVQNGYELDEIHDVQINAPKLAGQTLIYDQTNDLWKNARLTGTANQITVTNADAAVTLSIPTNPTLPGNLTVSGTGTSTFGGLIKSTGTGGYVVTRRDTNADVFQWYSSTGTLQLFSYTASGDVLTIGNTGNATLSGNLTVSGTGTSSFAGVLQFAPDVWQRSGSTDRLYFSSAADRITYLKGGPAAGTGTAVTIRNGADATVASFSGNGDTSVTGNLTVNGTGTSSFAGNLTLSTSGSRIATGTSDGTDNKYLSFSGGGAAANTRGSSVYVTGNEFTTGNAKGSLQLEAGYDATMSNTMDGSVLFSTGGTAVVGYFNRLGNLILGPAAADGGQKLQVAGSAKFNFATNTNITLSGSGTISTISSLNDAGNAYQPLFVSGSVLTFNIGGSESARFAATTGNLLIGTTTDGGQKLQVEGNAKINSTGATTRALSVTNSLGNIDIGVFGANGVGYFGTTTATDVQVYAHNAFVLGFDSTKAATFTGTIATQNGTASTPASASATGTAGTIKWDASYIYVCTATNTWKRVAIATW